MTRDNKTAALTSPEAPDGWRVAFPHEPDIADSDSERRDRSARANGGQNLLDRTVDGPRPPVLDLAWALGEHHWPDSRRALITPVIASQLLDRNTSNRKPRTANIRDMARDMVMGEFELSPHGVGINRQGVLVDGQQRLMALIQAGTTHPEVTLDTQFFVGLRPEVFDKIDTGAKRTAGDTLHLAGVLNEQFIASTVKVLLWLNQWGPKAHTHWRNKPIRNWQVRQSYDLLGPEALQESVKVGYRFKGRVRVGVSAVAASHYLFGHQAKAPADVVGKFFDDLRTGAVGNPADGCVVLRELFLQRERGGERNWDLVVQIAMIINAWNARVDGRHVMRPAILFDTRNPFPKIKEWPWTEVA